MTWCASRLSLLRPQFTQRLRSLLKTASRNCARPRRPGACGRCDRRSFLMMLLSRAQGGRSDSAAPESRTLYPPLKRRKLFHISLSGMKFTRRETRTLTRASAPRSKRGLSTIPTFVHGARAATRTRMLSQRFLRPPWLPFTPRALKDVDSLGVPHLFSGIKDLLMLSES